LQNTSIQQNGFDSPNETKRQQPYKEDEEMEIDSREPPYEQKQKRDFQNYTAECMEIEQFDLVPQALHSPVEVVKEQSKLDPGCKDLHNFYQDSTDYATQRESREKSMYITPFKGYEYDEILNSEDSFPLKIRKPHPLNLPEISN